MAWSLNSPVLSQGISATYFESMGENDVLMRDLIDSPEWYNSRFVI
jgi:hypothetical protein